MVQFELRRILRLAAFGAPFRTQQINAEMASLMHQLRIEPHLTVVKVFPAERIIPPAKNNDAQCDSSHAQSQFHLLQITSTRANRAMNHLNFSSKFTIQQR